MELLLRLVVCVFAVYVLVWLAGLYDDLVRWNERRKCLKEWRKRHG